MSRGWRCPWQWVRRGRSSTQVPPSQHSMWSVYTRTIRRCPTSRLGALCWTPRTVKMAYLLTRAGTSSYSTVRRGEAGDRCTLVGKVLANEARHIQVVGAEVMPPLRKAVCLVEDPRGDFAHADHLGECATSKLLGRDQNDPRVPESNLVER